MLYELLSLTGCPINPTNVDRHFDNLETALTMLPKAPFNMVIIDEDPVQKGHFDMLDQTGHQFILQPVKGR